MVDSDAVTRRLNTWGVPPGEDYNHPPFQVNAPHDFAAFKREIEDVYEKVVRPAKSHDYDEPYENTLMAYVVACFAWIDKVSALWRQSKQDDRIKAFMRKYMDVEAEAANVALYLWRNVLVHQFSLRMVSNRAAQYIPRLVWRAEESEHLAVISEEGYWPDPERPSDGPKIRIACLGLLNLAEQFEIALTRYIDELEKTPKLQANLQQGMKEWFEKTKFK